MQGVVYEGRSIGTMTPEKGEFQQPSAEGLGFKGKSFEQVVASVRPTAIVGAAAKRGSFSKPVIEALVQVFLSQMLSPFCVFLSQMLPPHVPPPSLPHIFSEFLFHLPRRMAKIMLFF